MQKNVLFSVFILKINTPTFLATLFILQFRLKLLSLQSFIDNYSS